MSLFARFSFWDSGCTHTHTCLRPSRVSKEITFAVTGPSYQREGRTTACGVGCGICVCVCVWEGGAVLIERAACDGYLVVLTPLKQLCRCRTTKNKSSAVPYCDIQVRYCASQVPGQEETEEYFGRIGVDTKLRLIDIALLLSLARHDSCFGCSRAMCNGRAKEGGRDRFFFWVVYLERRRRRAVARRCGGKYLCGSMYGKNKKVKMWAEGGGGQRRRVDVWVCMSGVWMLYVPR